MKQTWKKLLGMLLALSCMLALTACGGNEEVPTLDPKVETELATSTEQLAYTITCLSDEDIKTFKESQVEFEVMAMEAWDLARYEVGELVSIQSATVEYDGKEIVVVVPTEFSIYDATFTVVYDKYYEAESIAIDVTYPMGVTMQRAGLNTLMGIGIVFFVLLFLSFLISLFKYIPMILDRKKEAPAQAAAPKAAPVVVEEEELVDDFELVAVIAAAIAAAENTSTDSFVVRSIKKAKNRSWK